MSFLDKMHRLRSEPLTPAQKKVAAGIACIILIAGGSIVLDVVLDRGYAADEAPIESPLAQEPTHESEDEDKGLEAGKSDIDDKAGEPVGKNESADEGGDDEVAFAAGDTFSTDGFDVVNGTDGTVDIDERALASAIDTLITEADAQVDGGAVFTVVGAGSTSGVESVYLQSNVAGLEYIRAYRDSGASSYAVASFGSETVWLALMEADGLDTSAFTTPDADEGEEPAEGNSAPADE